jgi:hypothetical protein
LNDYQIFEQIGAPVYDIVTVKVRKPVSERILIINDDPDITLTFKGGIENNKRIEVYTYHNSICINIDESNIHAR